MNLYKVFKDVGKGTAVPEGYKNIQIHFVNDGRHCARLVAGGHLTDIPVDSVYSGVISLCGFRLLVFLAELNDLEVQSTDISSAYLEAYTNEEVCITAGPEFGPLENHRLLIGRALYGLCSSGSRWHDKFATCMQAEGFFPCKAEPDVWMRPAGDYYEYVAVYIDNLAFALDDPQKFVNILQDKHNFKLKGTGPIDYHLGTNFTHIPNGTLCISPKKYITECLVPSYITMFGEKPKTRAKSPLEKGDHPETDTSNLLDDEGIQQYQSLIGSLQWNISLGCYNIMCVVMTMSSFYAAPRIGQLEQLKQICGYLVNTADYRLCFRTHNVDYSDLVTKKEDWHKIYGKVSEILPSNCPEPLGTSVTLTHYIDANLMHDITTGCSVTACLHFINSMPIDAYSKKQPTVETATYGSEFVAVHTCVE